MDLADQVDLQVQGSTRLVYTSTNKALVLAGQLGVDIENTLSLKTVAGVDAKIARGSRESQSSGAPLKDRPFDLVQAATDALARTKGDLIRVRDARKNERRYVKVRAWAVCGGMAAKAVHPEHEADRRVVWWAGEAPEASFFLAGNVKNFVTPLAEGLLPDGGAPIRWNPSDYGGSDKMVTYLARAAVEDGDRDDEVFPEDWTHRMLLTFGLEERWGTSPAIEEGWYDFVFRCDDARTLVEPAGLDVVRRRHWKDTRRHVCLVGSPLWVARAERPTYGWYRVGRCHVVCDESYAVEGHPVEPGGYYAEREGGRWTGRVGLRCSKHWRSGAELRRFERETIPPPELGATPPPEPGTPKIDYWITTEAQESRDRSAALNFLRPPDSVMDWTQRAAPHLGQYLLHRPARPDGALARIAWAIGLRPVEESAG